MKRLVASLIFLMCSVVRAGEINIPGVTGATCYAVVVSSAGQWWNGSVFEVFSAGNYGNYDISAAEVGSTAMFTASFPAGTGDGAFNAILFRQSGGSPANGDIPLGSQLIEVNPVSTGTIVTAMSSATVASVSGSVGSVVGAVTVGTNNDKTGYGLTSATITEIATTAAAGVSVSTTAIAAGVWAASTSTMTNNGEMGGYVVRWLRHITNALNRRK